jgi:hypothetical protein
MCRLTRVPAAGLCELLQSHTRKQPSHSALLAVPLVEC